MREIIRRTAKKLKTKVNNKKVIIQSTEDGSEFLELEFLITTPLMDYSLYFDCVKEKTKYLIFWGSIKKELIKQFKFGEILIPDLQYRELNYFKPVSNSKLTIIITFKNIYGVKWYDSIPLDEIKAYIEYMQEYVNDKHYNLSERV
jgi:hypothetical protein